MNGASAGSFNRTRGNQNVLDENSNRKSEFSRIEAGRGNLDNAGHSWKHSDTIVAPTPSHSLLNMSNPHKSPSYPYKPGISSVPNQTQAQYPSYTGNQDVRNHNQAMSTRPQYTSFTTHQTFSNPTHSTSYTIEPSLPNPSQYPSSLNNIARLPAKSLEQQLSPNPRTPPGYPMPIFSHIPSSSHSFPKPRSPCHHSVPRTPASSPTSRRPHSPPTPRTPTGLPFPRVSPPITRRESPISRTDPGPPATKSPRTAWQSFPFRRYPVNSFIDSDDETEPEDFEELLKKLITKYEIN